MAEPSQRRLQLNWPERARLSRVVHVAEPGSMSGRAGGSTGTSSHLAAGKWGNQSLWQQLTLKQLLIKSEHFPPTLQVPLQFYFHTCFCFVKTLLPTNWWRSFTFKVKKINQT